MIVGHEEIIKNLKNLADRKLLSHGYIFWGQPRIGKRTIALSLANYLETGVFEKPSSVLLDCLPLGAEKNKALGIDEVRQIKLFLSQKPFRSGRRTVVVDEAENLTAEAQNALLKIAEEPQSSALIILILADPEKILPTIGSRLQKLYFSGAASASIKEWLKKEFDCGEKEADALAKKSFGQPGLAFAYLKDEDFKETLRAVKTVFQKNAYERRNLIKEIAVAEDFDFKKFLDVVLLETARGRNFDFWHRALSLRRQIDFFNLNPRLQLESLFVSYE